MWAALLGLMLVCSMMIFFSSGAGREASERRQGRPEEEPPVEEEIDVTRSGDLGPGDPLDPGQMLQHFAGQPAGVGLELSGQLEGEGNAQVPELRTGRVAELDVGILQGVPLPEPGE